MDRLMHTKDLMVHAYLKKISPFWDSTKETINTYLTQWRRQLDDYIDNGKGQGQEEGDYYSNMDERRGEDSMVEEKIKKTAKRILDYIDQLNQESVKSGMEQEEAKEKAQEIIKSITEEINVIPKQEEQVLGDRDIDIVAFEIQSIIKIALFEKTQLKEQLELVQTRLSDIVDKEDTDLLPLINALKLEIDHLRAIAENNVRKRTKQALDRLNQDVTMVTTRMKEDVQQAQRVALKDLRQVYRDIYHTNQVIDNLNIT